MSYILKCYNKSRNITDEYSLNNDSENKNSFRLLLGDAFSCVIDCFVLNDTKLINTFDISYESVDWLIIKRDYVDVTIENNNNFQSVLKFYIQDNYAKEERYAYLTLIDNLTGDTIFLTIEQPACIYKIEINDKDEDYALTLSEKLLQYEEDIEVKVYGGHEKLKLYNESVTTVSLTKEYPVVDGKVTIDYSVIEDKVTIGVTEYAVEDGKVTIDYIVANNKVTINGKEYTIVYKVTIDDKDYTVEDGKVTIDGVEYTVVEDKVTINGVEYPVVDKVTIEGKEYAVEDGTVTIDYTVVYKVTVDGVKYTVVDGKVSINGVEYTVINNKITINSEEYTVEDGTVIIEYPIENSKVVIEGTEYVVVDNKVIENIEVPVEDEFESEIGLKIKEIGLRQQLKDANVTVIENGIMTRYSSYTISVTFNGSLIDKAHKVIGYLRHYDDNETVKKLIYEIPSPVKNTIIKLSETVCESRQKRNKNGRIESNPLLLNGVSVKKVKEKIANSQSVIYNPLEEKYIEGTEIGIITTNKKGEHYSMIITESYAPLWCHVNTKYDYDNECHIVNVKCDNNFYGKTRKTRIFIRNAEVMGSIISYSVSQDTENKVTIERYQ